MCTIALAWGVFPDAPGVLAANRDELLDRPAEPPQPRDWGARVLAPRDGEAGGTWLGYNEHGLLVTITNRWDGRSREGTRSRGLLVRDALGYERAESAVRFVERELDEHSYEGFHLLAVDRQAALLVEFGPARRVHPLGPGIHVVVNVGADGEYTVPEGREHAGQRQIERAERVRAELRPEPGESATGWSARAKTILGDHDVGACIHGDGFGTRSSSLVRLGTAPAVEFADGPPCESAYERVEIPF